MEKEVEDRLLALENKANEIVACLEENEITRKVGVDYIISEEETEEEETEEETEEDTDEGEDEEIEETPKQ